VQEKIKKGLIFRQLKMRKNSKTHNLAINSLIINEKNNEILDGSRPLL
jgi:hypothetical protein